MPPDAPAAPGAAGRGRAATAAIVLIAAIAVCGLLIGIAPHAAEALLGLFGEPDAQGPVLAESLFTILLFGALLVAALVGGRLSGVRPLALGERRGAQAGLGLAIGLFGVAAATVYAWLAGTAGWGQGAGGGMMLLLWGTLLVLLQAGSEEVYFRGWLQPVLERSWGPAAAVLLSAVAFSLLHVIGGARTPLTIVNLFLGGLLFGLLTQRSGGIAAAVAGHFAWNWTEQALLGLMPNPGVSSFGALADLELAGSALWGGSDEGLNASLAMTLVLAALVAPLLIAPRRADVSRSAASAPDRSGPAPA